MIRFCIYVLFSEDENLLSVFISSIICLCLLKQGIEFVDSIYSIYVKREVIEEIMDSEICQWLKLLLQLVEITRSNATDQLKLYLDHCRPVIKKYRSLLEQCVSL